MNGEPTRGAKRQARNLQWSVSGLCLWARAMSRHSSNASHIVLCSAKIVLRGPYLSAIRAIRAIRDRLFSFSGDRFLFGFLFAPREDARPPLRCTDAGRWGQARMALR